MLNYAIKNNKEYMIDTLKHSKKLVSVGVLKEHADAYVEVVSEICGSHLATKKDLELFNSGLERKIDRLDNKIDNVKVYLEHKIDKLDSKIDNVKADLEHKIDKLDSKIDRLKIDLETRLTIKLGSIMVAGIGIIAILMKH